MEHLSRPDDSSFRIARQKEEGDRTSHLLDRPLWRLFEIVFDLLYRES